MTEELWHWKCALCDATDADYGYQDDNAAYEGLAWHGAEAHPHVPFCGGELAQRLCEAAL